MKKLFFILIILTPFLAFSQNTGYAGKKFIVKANVLKGAGVGLNALGVEYAISRHLSLNAGVATMNKTVPQTLTDRDIDFILPLYHPSLKRSTNGFERRPLPDATISSQSFSISAKTYLGRIVNRAPKGFFFEFGYEAGVATLSNGSYADSLIFDNSNNVKGFTYINNIKVKDINISSFKILMGYQEVFFKALTIEASIGLNISKFNTNGNDETLSVTTLSAPNYNNNLYTINSPDEGSGAYTTTNGITAFLKIGYLLF